MRAAAGRIRHLPARGGMHGDMHAGAVSLFSFACLLQRQCQCHYAWSRTRLSPCMVHPLLLPRRHLNSGCGLHQCAVFCSFFFLSADAYIRFEGVGLGRNVGLLFEAIKGNQLVKGDMNFGKALQGVAPHKIQGNRSGPCNRASDKSTVQPVKSAGATDRSETVINRWH